MKPEMTRTHKCMKSMKNRRNTAKKVERLKPKHRLTVGIIAINASLALAVAIMYFAPLRQNFAYSGFVISGGILCYGIYIIKTLSAYKERFFTPRRFSTPVSPDGSKLEDNSKELQKQIKKEISKDPPDELKLKTFFFAMIFVSITIATFLDGTFNLLQYQVWLFALVFSLAYLKQISWQMCWLSDKIAVYLSILLLCFFPSVIYVLNREDADVQSYMFAIASMIFTPALLIFTTTVVQHKLRKRIKERTIKNRRRK